MTLTNMRKKRANIISVIIVCLLSLGVTAQTATLNIPNPKDVSLTNWVSNPDKILSEQTISTINAKINTLYDSTTCQMVVVVIKGEKNTSARELSMDLFNKWKPGEKNKNNGLILVVCTQAKQAFVRTGYGVEEVITDAYATRIINTYMIPYFKENNWNKGIISGVNALANTLNKSYDKQGNVVNTDSVSMMDILIFYLIIGLVLLIVCVLRLNKVVKGIDKKNRSTKLNTLKKTYKQTITLTSIFMWWLFPMYWFFYKRLYNSIRREVVKCDCGGDMRLLSEAEEDEYLTKTQQEEELLKSMDYDVWLCDHCGQINIYAYNQSDEYEQCPRCKVKAYKKQSTEIIRGYKGRKILRTTYKCKSCSYTNHKDEEMNDMDSAFFAGGVAGGALSSNRSSLSDFGGSFGGGFGGGFSGGGGGGGSW